MIDDIFIKMMKNIYPNNNNFNMRMKNKIFLILRDIFNQINEKRLMNNNYMLIFDQVDKIINDFMIHSEDIRKMMNEFLMDLNIGMNRNMMMDLNMGMNINMMMDLNMGMNINMMMNPHMGMNRNMLMNPNMRMNINMMMNPHMEMNNNMMMENKLLEEYINKLTTADLKEAFEFYIFHNNFEKHEKCKCGKEFLILNKILSLPEYLIINVEKTNHKFLFPEKIDLTEEVQINLQGHLYRLISAIKKNEVTGFHLLFYYSQDKKKWFEFDNENIKECKFDEVLFVGDTYCLIYEKTN